MKNIKCLETNQICPTNNRKCKVCYLGSCNKVLDMIDIQERNIRLEQLQRLNKKLPEQCKNCSFLEVINLEKMEVRCFYKPKDRCILK